RAAARLDRRLAGGETAALLHARARLLDRAGRHGESFAAARRANGLVAATQARSGLGPGVPAATVDALIAATPAAALRQAPAPDRHSDLPVFIVGLPWSGASLVERIVAGHPQAHGAGPRRALAR